MRKVCNLAFSAGTVMAVLLGIGSASAQSSAGGWAIVAPDGTLGHNSNVNSVDHLSTGVYQVNFNNAVGACAADATIAGRGKKSVVPGYIVVGSGQKDNSILVHTFLTATLIPADFRFHMIVAC